MRLNPPGETANNYLISAVNNSSSAQVGLSTLLDVVAADFEKKRHVRSNCQMPTVVN